MASDIRPGVVLDGKYEILSLLGAGGMGEVFKARHVHLNAFRCIKVMKQSLLADDVYRTRFLREAQLATQIHHPNIAVVHDFFLAERGSYMVTEFIDGTTVRQWAKAFGRFPLALAADVAVQVLGGLDHIHRRGLLHRDISADNIMLSYERDDSLLAKIIDLGIAKDVNVATNETQAGMLVGNPKYMSPEQLGDLAAGEQVDNRADLYCLGVVLYEMLLGVPPFASETPHGYIVKHLTQAPRSFATVTPNIEWPDGLEAVIFRALEKDRRNRYADAREFSGALQRFLTAPPGSLTRTAVTRLRGGPEKTVEEPLPPEAAATEVTPPTIVDSDTKRDWKKTIAEDSIASYREYIEKHPDAPDTTEAKARIFELSLLEDVRERETNDDREGLKRLAEGHPPGSLVGNAARDALARLRTAQEEAQQEEDDFQRAWENGTSSAWHVFIDKYAASPRAARAQEFLDEAIAFEAATSTESDTTGLREFLKAWPEGRHHLEGEIRLVNLKERLAEVTFAQAIAADTAAALRDFVARFPSSSRIEEARRALTERLAFETAAAAGSLASWESYLGAWGNDRHAGEARARLESLLTEEETAFRAASEERTAAAWQAFLSKYPDGRRNARAERNRREAEAYDAARAGGRAAMESFLRTYSDGLWTKDARRLLRQLADEDDFAHARSLDSAAAWSLYLTTHPSGAHTDEARARLAAIEDVAFAAVAASKDPKMGAAFLGDFPDSPRREHVSRLVTAWSETAALRQALDAVGRGDVASAESLLRGITDPERRNEITAALESLQRQKETERRRTEPRDWDAAWEAGNVAAWEQYLAAHPDSPRLAEARMCRQEAVDFELAVATGSASMWRAFVKAWPEGRHRLDAEVRLRTDR
jgi:serine/threonine protein kinase